MKSKNGFALLELLVVVSLFALIGSAVYVFVIAPPKTTAPISERPIGKGRALPPELPMVPPSLPPPVPSVQPPTSPTNVFVIEIENENDLNYQEIAKKFYGQHADVYDFLAFFYDFDVPGDQNQINIIVQNTVEGIGLNVFNHAASYGSKDRLRGIGVLKNMSSVPNDILVYNALLEEIIAHQWGVYIGSLQGSQGALPIQNLASPFHWTPCMSFPRKDITQPYWHGNLWQDNRDGSWTLVLQDPFTRPYKFDPFMLYLMGFLPPERVPNAMVIVPESGYQCIRGTSRQISINDIINVYGPRVPLANELQGKFSIAYILLTKKAQKITPGYMEKISRWSTTFPEV